MTAHSPSDTSIVTLSATAVFVQTSCDGDHAGTEHDKFGWGDVGLDVSMGIERLHQLISDRSEALSNTAASSSSPREATSSASSSEAPAGSPADRRSPALMPRSPA